MQQRYWFEFAMTLADSPPIGTLLGCGITAESREQAISLLKERVFRMRPLPVIKRCVEDVDLGSLDQHHVIPNMADPNVLGVWYPLGYE